MIVSVINMIMHIIQSISRHKRLIGLVALVLVLTINFETAQQYYYIKRFELAANVSYLELFKNQSYRWLIWVVLSTILVWHTKIKINKDSLSIKDFTSYTLLIGMLVIINILLISLLQMLIQEGPSPFSMLFTEYIPFYTFQKVPIYVLSYFSLTVALHFYFANQELQIKVLEFGELKKLNTNLYEKMSETVRDKTSVLNIKVGKSHKVIPVAEISWIEADDYCVKVHTKDHSSYVMRMSLKALEEKLGEGFLRVHRKAIVNIHMVNELQSNGTHQLILKDLTEIPVSKSKLRLVKNSLMQF